MVTTNQHRIADFVRGFFIYLKSQQVSAAVLHGGEDGFERELSDVDFVVYKNDFKKLPNLIDSYCIQSGWRLCQILRHETTAAYFVCSTANDPGCAVALDACSDYQRNGTVMVTADYLLRGRRSLPWSGYGLNPEAELRYRFAKAAAKNKNVAKCFKEFAKYDDMARACCAEWLASQWGVSFITWDHDTLGRALAVLRRQTHARPSLLQPGSIHRIGSRILHPTGLVVVTGRALYDSAAIRLERTFGHLYFRRFRKATCFQIRDCKGLIESTLIVVPDISFPWTRILPAHCVFKLDPNLDANAQNRKLANHLSQRC